MNIIRNLPGPLLIFLGALSLSFGGLIVKSFEGATLWQILFRRSLFFSLTVLTFLIISYKKKTDLQNKICHKVAPSKDLTINPPKLRLKAPKNINSGPGRFLIMFIIFVKLNFVFQFHTT